MPSVATPSELAVLAYVQGQPGARLREPAAATALALGVTDRTVRRAVKSLARSGQLTRVGGRGAVALLIAPTSDMGPVVVSDVEDDSGNDCDGPLAEYTDLCGDPDQARRERALLIFQRGQTGCRALYAEGKLLAEQGWAPHDPDQARRERALRTYQRGQTGWRTLYAEGKLLAEQLAAGGTE